VCAIVTLKLGTTNGIQEEEKKSKSGGIKGCKKKGIAFHRWDYYIKKIVVVGGGFWGVPNTKRRQSRQINHQQKEKKRSPISIIKKKIPNELS